MGLRNPYSSPERRPSVEREIGYGEAFSSAFSLGSSEALIQNINRLSTVSELEKAGGQMLTPDEVKSRYKFDVYPTEDITENTAKYMEEEYNLRKRREHVAYNGPETFFGRSVVPFVGRMLGNMLDPAELTVGLAVGAGTGLLAKTLATSAKVAAKTPAITKAAKALHEGHRGLKFGVAATEAAAGTGLSLAVEQAGSEAIGVELTTEEMIQNLAFSALGFTGAIHVGGKVFNTLDKLGKPVVDKITRYLEEKKLNGLKPDMDRIWTAVLKNNIDDDTRLVVRNVFGDDAVDDILDGLELKKDIGQRLKDYVDEGVIEQTQLDEFMTKLDDANIAREHFDPELTDLYIDPETRQHMQETRYDVEKPEDFEFNPESKNVVKQAEEVELEYKAVVESPEYKKFVEELPEQDLKKHVEMEKAKQEALVTKEMKECLD